MSVTVTEQDHGFDALVARLSELGQSVTVGVHADAAPYVDGTDTVAVAASHEFGTASLPQRSFLRSWVDGGGSKVLGDVGADEVGDVVDGAKPDTLGEELGKAAVNGILAGMATGIRGQAHPGYTGNTAGTVQDLDDTGHLRSQVEAKVTAVS